MPHKKSSARKIFKFMLVYDHTGRYSKSYMLLCLVIFYSVFFPVILQSSSINLDEKNKIEYSENEHKNSDLTNWGINSGLNNPNLNLNTEDLGHRSETGSLPYNGGISNDQLIDGFYSETYNFSSYSNQIIQINNSDYGEITELSMNFTDIKDIRNYIINGNFSDNIDNWSYNTTTDIGFTSENSNGILNFTGVKSSNPFYSYNGNEEHTDDLSNDGDWLYSSSGGVYSIGRSVTRNLYGDTGCIISELGDPIYANGYASGYSYMNFTYNGTNKILDSELSFYYDMEVGDSWTSENSISTNLSVSIIQPNGTEIKLDDWMGIYSPSIKGSLGKTYHSFNNSVIKSAVYEPGNYTLKFYFGHVHYYSGSGIANFYSKILVDGINLNVNYSKKVYSPDDKILVNQNFDCDRENLQSVNLKLDYLITKPFEPLNSSDSNFSIWLNDHLIYSEFIRDISWEQGNYLDLNLNPDYVYKQNNNISMGINFDPAKSVIFYPNTTWSLILDNVSLEICGEALPSSIDLAIYNSVTSSISKINTLSYGNGTYSVINASIFYQSQFFVNDNGDNKINNYNNTVKFVILSNTTELSCNTSLILKKISWRDSIFSRIADIEEKLKSILLISQNSIFKSEFLQYYLPNINNVVELVSNGRIDEAIKNSSTISENFPFLLNSLFTNLNSKIPAEFLLSNSGDPSFNRMELLSLGNFQNVRGLFTEIKPFYNNFEYINFDHEGINQQVYATYYTLTLRLQLQLQQIKDRVGALNPSLEELSEVNPNQLSLDLNSMINSLSKMEYGLDSYVILQNLQKFIITSSLNGENYAVLKEMPAPMVYLNTFSDQILMGDNIFNSVKSSAYPKSLEFEYLEDKNTSLQIPLINNLPGIFNIPFSHYNVANISSDITKSNIYSNISKYFSRAGLYDNQTEFVRGKTLISSDDYLNLLTLQFLISDTLFRTNIEGFLGTIYNPLESFIKDPLHLPSYKDIFNTTNDATTDIVDDIKNSITNNFTGSFDDLKFINNNSLGLGDFLELNISFNYDSLLDFGNVFYTNLSISPSDLCEERENFDSFINNSYFVAVQNIYLETGDEIYKLNQHLSYLEFNNHELGSGVVNSSTYSDNNNSSFYAQIPLIAPDFVTNLFLYSLIKNPSKIQPRYMISIEIYANSTLIKKKMSKIPYFIDEFTDSFQSRVNIGGTQGYSGNLEFTNDKEADFSDSLGDFSFISEDMELSFLERHEISIDNLSIKEGMAQYYSPISYIYSLNLSEEFLNNIKDFSSNKEKEDLMASIIIYETSTKTLNIPFYLNWTVYSDLVNPNLNLKSRPDNPASRTDGAGIDATMTDDTGVDAAGVDASGVDDTKIDESKITPLIIPNSRITTSKIPDSRQDYGNISKSILYNSSKNAYECNISSVNPKYSSELKAFIFKFNLNEFLSEFGIDDINDVDLTQFRRLFNISFVVPEIPINYEDLSIKFVIEDSLSSNIPMWVNNSDIFMSINDIDLKFELTTSILSLGRNLNTEFRISKITLDYNEQILNSYYYTFYNSSAWTLDSSQSIFLRLYMRNIATYTNFTIRVYYLLEQRNGNEIQGYTDLNINIENVYHFNKPISPNLMIGIIIGLISLSIASYIIKMHSNIYYIRLLLGGNKKDFFKNKNNKGRNSELVEN